MLYLKHTLKDGTEVILTQDCHTTKPFRLTVGRTCLRYEEFRDAMDDFTGTIAFEM